MNRAAFWALKSKKGSPLGAALFEDLVR